MAMMIEFAAGMLVGTWITTAVIFFMSRKEPEPKQIHTPAPGETILPESHSLTEQDRELLREIGLRW